MSNASADTPSSASHVMMLHMLFHGGWELERIASFTKLNLSTAELAYLHELSNAPQSLSEQLDYLESLMRQRA